MTVQTLLEVANVFDVALEVRFTTYSSFICNTRDVSVVSMRVPEFKDDLGLRGFATGNQPIVAAAGSSKEIQPWAGMNTIAPTEPMFATLH